MTREHDASDEKSETTVLPGELEVDEALVQRVLEDLDVHSRGQGLDAAIDIANCVIDLLFLGDVAKFRTRSRTHETFRALQSADLPLSKSALWYALAVREQVEILPEEVVPALSLAHHKVLLRVKDSETKIVLAQKAIREHLSKREFERRIRQLLSKEEVRGRGRPRLPAVIKGLRRITQATDLATSEPISPATIRRMEREHLVELLQALDENLEVLNELGAKLRDLTSDLDSDDPTP